MISVEPLAVGDEGTRQSLGAMRRLVAESQADPAVRAAVVAILRGHPSHLSTLDLSTLLQYVRDRVRYQSDPVDVEYIQSPARLLAAIRRDGMTEGDCDDMAVLVAALAEAAGYPTRFVVQGPPDADFSHVIVEAQTPAGGWVALDPTRSDGGIGAAPASVGAREAREMGRNLGQVDWSFSDVPSGFDWGAAPTAPSVIGIGTPVAAPPTSGSDVGSFFSDLFKGVTQAAPSILGVLERTGVYRPITGYYPSGEPIYAGAVAPIGGVYGAGYSYLTQQGPLGLSMGTWLLVGGGVLLVVLTKGRK